MRTKTLDFLKNVPQDATERFNVAMALATQSGISAQMLARFNRKGATPANADSLVYELQRFHAISNVEIAEYTAAAPEKKTAKKEAAKAEPAGEDPDAFMNVLREMNDEAKEGLKFRTQYPFLREEDTPMELKALAADAITSFENFREKHDELFRGLQQGGMTETQVYETAAGLLKDFQLNRAIHDELEHYAKNKEILGKHEVFADLALQREVDEIPAEKLGSAKGNTGSNISKKKKALKAAKLAEDKAKYTAELEILEKRKALIDARIQAATAKE